MAFGKKTSGLIAACLLAGCLSAHGQLAETASFFDDFAHYADTSRGLPTWLPIRGDWQVREGTYRQLSSEYDCAAMSGRFVEGSFEIGFRFRTPGPAPGAGLFWNAESRNSTRFSHMVRLDSPSTMLLGYFEEGNYQATNIVHFHPLDIAAWHEMRLVVDGESGFYDVLLDGQLVAVREPLRYRAGHWGLQSSAGETWFDDVWLAERGRGPSLDCYWAREFALRAGRIYAPVPHLGQIAVYSTTGQAIGRVELPRPPNGSPAEPVAVAVSEEGFIFVVDSANRSIHKFDPEGHWLGSTGAGEGTGLSLEKPAALALSGGTLFVVDRGRRRVCVFNLDLHGVGTFGEDRLQDPVDIAGCQDTLAVLDAGRFSVDLYRWSGSEGGAHYLASVPSGYTHPRAVEMAPGGIYLSRADGVIWLNSQGREQARFSGWALRGFAPWGLAWDGRDLWVVDYGVGRFLRLPLSLAEFQPEVRFAGRKKARIRWQSTEPVAGVTRVFRGRKPAAEKAERKASRVHALTVGRLDPCALYHVEIDPAVRSVPQIRFAVRAWPFVSPPGKGTMCYVALPAVAILFANVWDKGRWGPNADGPPLLAENEIRRIVEELYDGVRFYWMNSGLRFFLDLDTVIVRAPVRREEVFENSEYAPPREQALEKAVREAGSDLSRYRAVFCIACVQEWRQESRKWELAGRGGAFTVGLGSNGKYGLSWWEATPASHASGNNWLLVHEFHHQLDELFLLSGYPDYWFNHFSPTVGTAADFGEHFDGNAYLLRTWPQALWFDLDFGEIRTTADADEDGVPDDDPHLPMDERRLRSSPRHKDSDGDRLSDGEEIRLSNWVVDGVGERYGGARLFPNLIWRDTDGDGLSDAKDPAPLYPVEPLILYGTPRLDGQLESGEWPLFAEFRDPRVDATIYAAWDTSALWFGFRLNPPVGLKIQIDGDADGWFLGRDNLLVELRPDSAYRPVLFYQVFNCTVPERWPFWDPELRQRLVTHVAAQGAEHEWVVELGIRRSPQLGLELKRGEAVGILLGFQAPLGEHSRSCYLTLFEPHRFLDVRLVDEPGLNGGGGQ
ncbi:MAG: hypothetical protein ONB23_02370 [candidate division KSB1 bacterium]|nr:hypothetical protein [candidate division KSB1 bacterium]